MKLNSLLNLDEEQEVEYMEQDIYIQYNGKKCYYTIERDNEGNIDRITGYNQVIKQINNNGKVTIANIDELTMDDILKPNVNYDYYELQQVIYEMYVNDIAEMTCKLIYPYQDDEEITFKIGLLDCIVTI